VIELRDVHIRFKDRTVLRSVHLHVPPQSAVTFIGPSNSGKSVLLKLIAGLLLPTQGIVRVESQRVSMLFQKNALFDSLNLLENLLLPLQETLGIQGADAEARSLELLEAVGLKESAHLYPNEISGGMQKRLGIARALIIEPEVILYDEPTAGLDPITGRSIADLIQSLHHKNKTTLVMVTNDLQRAYQISDQIYYCHHQALKPLGSPSQVLATPDPEIRAFIYSNALHHSAKS
jgi:phospholipid/cholesterol/gamma-HCH transport system ATP-binding protein